MRPLWDTIASIRKLWTASADEESLDTDIDLASWLDAFSHARNVTFSRIRARLESLIR